MTKKFITLSALIFTLFASGCASRCDSQRMGLVERFQNRPRPIRDLFSRGDRCNDCNPHAGQIYSDAFSSDCQSGLCGSGVGDPPVGFYPSDQMSPITTGYAPYSEFGGIGTGAVSPGNSRSSLPPSSGELEMPPMYGNGR